jgi:mRNA interferase RelE/StbE
MTYSIEFKPSAQRQLARLHQAIVPRLQAKIDALAENPRPNGYKKLQGFQNRYRIRVGEYRVIYEIHDEILLVLIVKVGPRGDIY